MRNRAKCKLCREILESFHENDYVLCKCGQIAINGGSYKFWTHAHDYDNFLRIDDQNNEIPVKLVKESAPDIIVSEEIQSKLSRKDMIDMLDEMCRTYERLPASAIYSPINHADFCSALMLIGSILKEST